jgi:hypothetical protein
MVFEKLIDKFQNAPASEDRRQAAEDLIANNLINEISIKAFSNGLLDIDIGIRDVSQRALIDAPAEFKVVVASAVAPYINMREIELRNLVGEILTKLGSPSVPILLPYLKSNDFDVRKFACDILGLIGDEKIVPHIIPLLSDNDKNVQLSAVETLGNLPATPETLDALIMVYENFEEIKSFVIESIGKIGGENSESYLLEQLENEKDIFLQTTIIDALSYNAKSIDISYKLLERMPNVGIEMQKIMLMTAFAISFRLEECLLMPDALRYVSHKGMLEKDENIMIASLISLGDSYRSEDVESLLKVITVEHEDLTRKIMYNLAVNSSTEMIAYFFEQFFAMEENDEQHYDIFDILVLFWDEISAENKNTIIDSLLINFELTSSHRILLTLEMLQSQDGSLVNSKLLKYSSETSEENRLLIEKFLKK